MEAESKQQKIALLTTLVVCLLLFLQVGGSLFARYLDQRIYEQRTNQLAEPTSQEQANLRQQEELNAQLEDSNVKLAQSKEAVDTFEVSQPGDYDLILMDVQMPVLNGYEATRTIRAGSHPSAKEIPIIAMTANAFVDDVREAINSGMDAHIAKPVQVDTLRSTIRQVLDSRLEQSEKARNVE